MTTNEDLTVSSLTANEESATKVPEVTPYFWIVKVLTTGMGEAVSDYLMHLVGLTVAPLLGAAALTVALVLQFRAPRYVAWRYWSAVAMVSVFGTMTADGIDYGIGVPLQLTTPVLLAVLALVFVAWFRSEGTLSIHTITTRRREFFYWGVVLTTFALGTAAGDLTAGVLHWGYLGSGLVFAALIAVPAVAFRWPGLNAIVAFWFAYILTRPLGASFADWMAVLPRHGGLGLHVGPVTLVWSIAIVAFVTFLAITRKDVQRTGLPHVPLIRRS